MSRAHFDTVLMIITGRVVPWETAEASNVKSLSYKTSLDALYDTLSIIMGKPVYSHELPACIWIAASFFIPEYPEINPETVFPYAWEDYQDWRGAFLSEHDLPDWYDIPKLDTSILDSSVVLRGTPIEFLLKGREKPLRYCDTLPTLDCYRGK